MAIARTWRLRVDGDCEYMATAQSRAVGTKLTDGSRKLRLNESAVGGLALEHACFPSFLSYYFAPPTFSFSNACIQPS